MKDSIFKQDYFLTAGECDATGHLPVTLLTERIIEIATGHANRLGIGYANLVKEGIGWVLSRLSIEMYSYPGINDSYSITTWIESFTRHFSERNMVVNDGGGNVIGFARTVWAPIDFKTRGLADLTRFMDDAPTGNLECPIERFPKIRKPRNPDITREYEFRYCDLDFNRHVNTVRYISLLLNQWPLECFDKKTVRRFDIGFAKECYFSQRVAINIESEGDISECELERDGERVLAARIVWADKMKIDESDRD